MGSGNVRTLIERIGPAVCRVQARDLTAGPGSGFFAGSGRYVITCHHVVAEDVPDRQGGIVVHYSGDIRVTAGGQEWTGRVIPALASSTLPRAADFALLEVEGARGQVPRLPLGSYDMVAPGDEVLVPGYPLHAESLTVTAGIVASTQREASHLNRMRMLDVIVVDASVNPGNSGGPLFHIPSGTVVGVVALRWGNIGPYVEELERGRVAWPPELTPALSSIVDALKAVNGLINPGLGQAVAIDYARQLLGELPDANE